MCGIVGFGHQDDLIEGLKSLNTVGMIRRLLQTQPTKIYGRTSRRKVAGLAEATIMQAPVVGHTHNARSKGATPTQYQIVIVQRHH